MQVLQIKTQAVLSNSKQFMLGLTVDHQQLIKSPASMWAVDMTVTRDVTQFRTSRFFAQFRWLFL